MSTKLEQFNQLKIDIAMGKGNQTGHWIDHEQVRKQRRAKPTKTNYVKFDAYSPEARVAFLDEKDRFFTVCPNVHIAMELMTRVLHETTDDALRAMAESGHQHPGDVTPGPEKSVIPGPDWLK